MEEYLLNKDVTKELCPGKVEEARTTLEVLKIISDYYKQNPDRREFNKFYFELITENLKDIYRNYLPTDLKIKASNLLGFFGGKINPHSSVIKQKLQNLI